MDADRGSFVLSSTSYGAAGAWVSAAWLGADDAVATDPPVDLAGYLALQPAWMARASCREGDLADFFPERGDTTRRGAALSLCASCCVVEECLGTAMDMPGCGFGIWGGTTQAQRLELRRQRQLQEEAA